MDVSGEISARHDLQLYNVNDTILSITDDRIRMALLYQIG